VPVGYGEALVRAIDDYLAQGFPDCEKLKGRALIYYLNNIAERYLEVLNLG